MTDTTCPTCGGACRIMGDPSSVTRWYEPLGQDAGKLAAEVLDAALHWTDGYEARQRLHAAVAAYQAATEARP